MRRVDSVLFAPYKQVGVVCSEVRPVVRIVKRKLARSMHSLLCAVDNTVVHYNAANLRPVAVSDPLEFPVSAIAADVGCVYVANGPKISLLPTCRFVESEIEVGADIKHLLLFGENLFVVDVENRLSVISTATKEIVLTLEWPKEVFEVSVVVHPATYLNKVLLGSTDGRMRLLNVRTGKLLFEFVSGCPKNSRITSITQSPALDVVGVGYESGRVELRNLKTNETLMDFKHENEITAIGFRTDGEPLMTTGDSSGMMAVWNLEKQSLIGRLTDVHSSSVHLLHFIDGEAIMLSASFDNSLRVWVLDQPDGMPRQLVINEGHAKPVNSCIFTSKHEVISSGKDESVRKYSVIIDTLRQKLGSAGTMKRSKAKKNGVSLDVIRLPPVVELAFGWTREAAWDNVLARHEDELIVTTWTTRKQSLGTHQLVHDRFKKDPSLRSAVATAIAISPCGNTAYIGYSTGHIDVFNVQSARHVRTLVAPNSTTAHDSEVTILTLDARGRELISASASGRLRFWDTREGTLTSQMRAPAQGRVVRASACTANSLVAIVLEKRDGNKLMSASVTLIDSLCRRVVRSFPQPEGMGSIPSVAFTPDGRWVLIADEKGHLRVWDIASSYLVDVIKFGSPCISVSFNPSGEFMATCHKDQRAVFLWASKSHFDSPVELEPIELDYEPSWKGVKRDAEEEFFRNLNEDNDDLADFLMEYDDEEKTREEEKEIDESRLVELSGLAPSRWANLPDLDIIRQRNKPIEPAKKPKRAPFFLSAAATLEGFEFEKEKDDTEERRKIAEAKRNLLELESAFSSKLRNASTHSDLLEAFRTLKKMSLSAIDFQMRTLSPDVITAFLRMLLSALRMHEDFDLVQAYLATLIKVHRTHLWSEGDDLNDETGDVLSEILETVQTVWRRMDEPFIETSSIVAFAKSALV